MAQHSDDELVSHDQEFTEVDPDKKVRRSWQSLLSGSPVLLLTLLVHFLFGLIATIFIVQRIQEKRKQLFTAAATNNVVALHQLQHDKTMAKKQQSLSPPDVYTHITTIGASPITLPDVTMPMMTDNGEGTPKMEGVGLPGGGMGASVPTPEVQIDATMIAQSVFGTSLTDPDSQHLVGTFYDFTRDQSLNPVKHPPFQDIINDFIANGYEPSNKFPHYKSPKKLYIKYLLVPLTPDEDAGKAFQSPASSKAFWIVHYHGRFESLTSGGMFRFVGFGDNVLEVRIDDKLVLDASDRQYLKMNFKSVSGVRYPGKPSTTPVFVGNTFSIAGSTPVTIDILIGDEGGVTTSGLFIQRGQQSFSFDKLGVPMLPLFTLGELTEAEKKVLSDYMTPACFTSPVPFAVVLDDNAGIDSAGLQRLNNP